MLSDVAKSVVRYTDSTFTSSGPSGMGHGELRKRLVALEAQQLNANEKVLRCSLLNQVLPRGNVIAAHLAKRSWHGFVKPLLGFVDVDDVRNGLLLHKSIEWAFDTSRLAFVWDAAREALVAHVLDPSILPVLLSKKAEELLRSPPTGRYTPDDAVLAGRTFGSVDGLALVARHAPFRRCLCMHAHLAREEAVHRGWLRSVKDFPFDDFWSEAGSAHDKVLAWLRLPEAQMEAEDDAVSGSDDQS